MVGIDGRAPAEEGAVPLRASSGPAAVMRPDGDAAKAPRATLDSVPAHVDREALPEPPLKSAMTSAALSVGSVGVLGGGLWTAAAVSAGATLLWPVSIAVVSVALIGAGIYLLRSSANTESAEPHAPGNKLGGIAVAAGAPDDSDAEEEVEKAVVEEGADHRYRVRQRNLWMQARGPDAVLMLMHLHPKLHLIIEEEREVWQAGIRGNYPLSKRNNLLVTLRLQRLRGKPKPRLQPWLLAQALQLRRRKQVTRMHWLL